MKSPYSWLPRILQTLAWVPGRIILHIFFRLRVHGAEHVRAAATMRGASGVIFAVTHVSEFDPVILLSGISPLSPLFPMQYVLAPTKHFKNPGFGWRRYVYGPNFFSAWGAYPIVPGLHDYSKSLEKHVDLLKGGKSVCIFPTGGVGHEGEVKPAHGGVAYLAETANAIVVPVLIKGTNLNNISWFSFLTGRHDFCITYGEPLRASALVHDTDPVPERYKVAAEYLMSVIMRLRVSVPPALMKAV